MLGRNWRGYDDICDMMWLRDGFWIKSNFHTFRFNECQDDAFVLKAGKSFLLAKLSLLDPWFECRNSEARNLPET